MLESRKLDVIIDLQVIADTRYEKQIIVDTDIVNEIYGNADIGIVNEK